MRLTSDQPAAESSTSTEADEEFYRTTRRRVRRRVRFYRHVAEFVAAVSFFFFIDWVTGGSGSGINWAQWIAAIWAFFLFLEFWSIYVTPRHWWRGVEDRCGRTRVTKRSTSQRLGVRSPRSLCRPGRCHLQRR